MLRQWLSRVAPGWIKSTVRDAVQRYLLGAAIRHLVQLPKGQPPGNALLEALHTAWGNEGFSANLPFLAEVAKQAAAAKGPILECGSGLTTILLGALAGRRGIPIYTLEHAAEWFAQLFTTLRRYEIPGVALHLTRLISYGSFEWYQLPNGHWPSEFQLVVCDGPPNATTAGGRYGLLPVVGPRLTAGAIILLDDATYPAEVLVRQRWHLEHRMREEIHEGPDRAYAVLTLDGDDVARVLRGQPGQDASNIDEHASGGFP